MFKTLLFFRNFLQYYREAIMKNQMAVIALVSIVFTTCLFSGHVLGLQTPDQEFIIIPDIGTGIDEEGAAQTFTVGQAGILSRIDLVLSLPSVGASDQPDGVDVEIYNFDSEPEPTLLGGQYIPRHLIPTSAELIDGIASVDVSDLNIEVAPGDVLGIVVSSPSDDYAWWRGAGYEGGRNFLIDNGNFRTTYGSIDYGFRTYVTAPNTATVNFESLLGGVAFSSVAGQSPGDLIFTENGIGVTIDEFTRDLSLNISLFSFAVTEANEYFDPLFSTTSVSINNVQLGFDLAELPGDVFAASFEFADLGFEFDDPGGVENLVINGVLVEELDFSSLPASVNGVNISVNDVESIPGGSRGRIELTGPIDSIAIGGQGLSIDDVTFSYALLGDVDLDGTVSFADISSFISVLSAGSFQEEADCNRSGTVDFADLSPFVNIIGDSGS